MGAGGPVTGHGMVGEHTWSTQACFPSVIKVHIMSLVVGIHPSIFLSTLMGAVVVRKIAVATGKYFCVCESVHSAVAAAPSTAFTTS